MSNKNLLKIESVKVLPYRLDFNIGVEHSLSSRSYTVNVGVIIESSEGLRGYGECVPRKYVTGENIGSVKVFLDSALPSAAEQTFLSPEQIIDFLDTAGTSSAGQENPAGVCALELALLDLAGKNWDVTVPEMLGLTRRPEPLIYSLVVPLFSDEELARFIEKVTPFNFKHIKIKVDGGNPAEYVRRVKSFFDDAVEIRVDANCSWNKADAPVFMEEMASLGVVSVEQPMAAHELEAMAELRAEGMPLIVLDESVRSSDDVVNAAGAGACDIVNVRVSKCGGMLGALRVIDKALENGLGVQLGAHVGESCILSAAGAHLASGLYCFRWLEGCFGLHLLVNDLCDEPFRFGYEGRFEPPEGPGLGVMISEKSLRDAHERFKEMVNSDTVIQ